MRRSSKSRPIRRAEFVVYAGEGRATATQASFNIRKDDDTVCVTCIRGNVHVQYRQRETVLQERQQLSYDARGIGSVASTDPKIVTAWQQGLLVFREVPLARVIDEVNRYRPGKIIPRRPAARPPGSRC